MIDNKHTALVNVVLADDDPDDRMFFEDAATEINADINLFMVNDGEELMQFLLNTTTIIPEIIFLDLNMPRKNGFECLTEIRSNNKFQHTFIVIYSTTGSRNEIEETFNKGANLFINKLNTYSDLKASLTKVFALDFPKYFPQPVKAEFVLIA